MTTKEGKKPAKAVSTGKANIPPPTQAPATKKDAERVLHIETVECKILLLIGIHKKNNRYKDTQLRLNS